MANRAANKPTSLREQFESLLSEIKDLYKEASSRCDDDDRNNELWAAERMRKRGSRTKSSIDEAYQKRSEERSDIYKRHEESLRKFKAFPPVVRKCLSDLRFHLGTEAAVSLLQRFKEKSPQLEWILAEGTWEDARDYLGELRELIDEGIAILTSRAAADSHVAVQEPTGQTASAAPEDSGESSERSSEAMPSPADLTDQADSDVEVRGDKSVPIPKSLPDRLRKAIREGKDTLNKAAKSMDVSAKTARKLLSGEGAVHRETLTNAEHYINEPKNSQ